MPQDGTPLVILHINLVGISKQGQLGLSVSLIALFNFIFLNAQESS